MTSIVAGIIIIFVTGSVLGWVIEMIYRSIKNKKFVNPGFLRGPYLPIYGFAIIILWYVVPLDIHLGFRLLLSIFLLVLLELITGLLLVYFYNLRLWDYSKERFNYKGFISLEHSLYWLILSGVFYFFVYPLLVNFISFINTHTEFLIIFIVFYFLFFIDVLYTLVKRKASSICA